MFCLYSMPPVLVRSRRSREVPRVLDAPQCSSEQQQQRPAAMLLLREYRRYAAAGVMQSWRRAVRRPPNHPSDTHHHTNNPRKRHDTALMSTDRHVAHHAALMRDFSLFSATPLFSPPATPRYFCRHLIDASACPFRHALLACSAAAFHRARLPCPARFRKQRVSA